MQEIPIECRDGVMRARVMFSIIYLNEDVCVGSLVTQVTCIGLNIIFGFGLTSMCVAVL